MKIAALLSFFDEYPSWLAAAVSSAARVCEHVVAVDGAYMLLGGGTASSGPEQHAALADAAAAAGVGLTLHVPSQEWIGEVEKRAFMFDLGRTTGADWFCVIDADEIVIAVPPDLHVRLDASDADVAVCGLVASRREPGIFPTPTWDMTPVRCLYRNIPGLTVAGTHYGYTDGRRDLWAGAPALDLMDLRIAHRPAHRRAAGRRARQEAYYRTRDLAGIEKESVHA